MQRVPVPTPASLDGDLTVGRMLDASSLHGSRLLAGADGLGRRVQRLNVMEVPDILDWVKPQEFLLTTAYPLREVPGQLADLVEGLDDRRLAGMGIKVGRYLDAIPQAMLDRADERGFPIVRLPDGASFDDILNQVLTDILNRQAAILSRSEEAHRALLDIVLSGGGLPEVARVLSGLLATPVVVSDEGGTLLASARLAEARPLLEATGALDREGTVQIDPHGTDESAGGMLLVAIHAGGRLRGQILAVETDRALDAGDLLAVRNAATVAALVMTQEEAVAAVEGKYASDFLHDLLAGRVTDEGDALSRSAALGWDVTRDLVVMVAAPLVDPPAATAAPRGPDQLARVASGVRSALLPRDRQAAVVRLSGEVVVITGADHATPQGRESAKRLAAALASEATVHAGGDVSVGVSRSVRGPAGVENAYRQADRALRIGRDIAGDSLVSHFDDLGIYRLLSLVDDRAELNAYATETLGPLAAEDAEAAELRRTLTVLLEENLNIAASARRLHFHYNTLRYRVDKLQRLLGPFTTDQRLRLDLQVALCILQLRTTGR